MLLESSMVSWIVLSSPQRKSLHLLLTLRFTFRIIIIIIDYYYSLFLLLLISILIIILSLKLNFISLCIDSAFVFLVVFSISSTLFYNISASSFPSKRDTVIVVILFFYYFISISASTYLCTINFVFSFVCACL